MLSRFEIIKLSSSRNSDPVILYAVSDGEVSVGHAHRAVLPDQLKLHCSIVDVGRTSHVWDDDISIWNCLRHLYTPHAG